MPPRPTLDLKQLRFQRMVEEIDDYAILLLDQEGKIENWNRGAERIKGYKSEEMIGKNFRIFYTPADQQSRLPERLIAKAALEGKAKIEGPRVQEKRGNFLGQHPKSPPFMMTKAR